MFPVNGVKQVQGVQGMSGPNLEAYGPLSFDFGILGKSTMVDLTAEQQFGRLSAGRSIWIDNGSNPNFLTLYIQTGVSQISFTPSGQRIVVKANTQGWYALLTPRPILFNVFSSAAAGKAQMWITNYKVRPAVWSTI